MTYNYTPTGLSQADRITLNPGYQPQNGYAFSVAVTDPDNTGNIVSFNTNGSFFDTTDQLWKSTIRIGTAPNAADLVYTPNSANNLNVSSGSANTNFGTFRITALGVGAVVLSQDLRFQIAVNMSAPYTGTKIMRGWIKAGNLSLTSPVQFDFDSPVYQIMGSTITLNSDPLNINFGSTTAINGNMTSAEPYRVVVTATGYGPRGAKKILEATVQKNFFNGMTAPATLTLVGISTGAVFEPGSSTGTEYSGDDVVTNIIIPPIGTSNDDNLNTVLNKVRRQPPHPFNGSVVGTPANVSMEMPFWLESATNLNSTLQSLKTTQQPIHRRADEALVARVARVGRHVGNDGADRNGRRRVDRLDDGRDLGLVGPQQDLDPLVANPRDLRRAGRVFPELRPLLHGGQPGPGFCHS
jgi:hypothetical protein